SGSSSGVAAQPTTANETTARVAKARASLLLILLLVTSARIGSDTLRQGCLGERNTPATPVRGCRLSRYEIVVWCSRRARARPRSRSGCPAHPAPPPGRGR